MILGGGSFGTVKVGSFAVKNYEFKNVTVSGDAIREASILHHLNDHKVEGVPELRNIEGEYIDDGIDEYINTTTVMDLGGRSLRNILSEVDSIKKRCEIMEEHIDDIIRVVSDIHRAGVIHNDLHLGNILIDEQSVVNIIDFGYSIFGQVTIDGEIEPESGMTLYVIPESLHDKFYNVYASDYWVLGATILNACLDDSYVPIRVDNSNILDAIIGNGIENSAKQLLGILDRRLDLKQLSSGKVRSRVIIPDSITPKLSRQLSRMLQINYRDRQIDNVSIPLTLSEFSINISRDPWNTILSYIARLLIGYYEDVSSSSLGVIIDIIRRSIWIMGDLMSTSPKEASMALVLCVAETTSFDYEFSGSHQKTIIDVNGIEIKKVIELQLLILNYINWKVLTSTNVRLSNNGNTKMVCEKLVADNNRHRLIGMSDREIYNYFHEL
jgi:serine/threonine protein kinase